jgi:D-alanyl-D-alanine carboxypeptidase
LNVYEGACGVKTGYTKQAGRCLVSAATREGMTLVCTLLNCPQTYERTKELFDDVFNHYKNVCLLHENDSLQVTEQGKSVVCATEKSLYYPLLEEEIPLVQRVLHTKKGAYKAKKGEIVGRFEIFLLKQLLFSGNLYKI